MNRNIRSNTEEDEKNQQQKSELQKEIKIKTQEKNTKKIWNECLLMPLSLTSFRSPTKSLSGKPEWQNVLVHGICKIIFTSLSLKKDVPHQMGVQSTFYTFISYLLRSVLR